MGAQQPSFPKAKTRTPEELLINSQNSETRGYIRKIIDADEQKDKQIAQYADLLEKYRQELEQLKARIAPLEKFENLAKDTAKYWHIYLRDRITRDAAGKVLLQVFGKNDGDVASEVSGVKKRASVHLNELVEECVRYGTTVIPHIIKQNLQDNKQWPKTS